VTPALAGDAVYRETLLEASALAERLGDNERQVKAALANHRAGWAPSAADRDDRRVAALEAALAVASKDHPAWRARLLATLAAELTYAEDIDRRRGLADEALDLARGLDEPTTLSRVLVSRFQTICAPGTLLERRDNSAELLTLSTVTGDPFAGGLRTTRCCGRASSQATLRASTNTLPTCASSRKSSTSPTPAGRRS